MKLWWEYCCDFGHSWEILRSSEFVEQPEDRICKHGHEAVTLGKAEPADFVEVSIYPAVREVDYVTKRIGLENKFHVIVRAVNDDWQVISSNRYTKKEAIELVEAFAGLSLHQAQMLCRTKKLGEPGNRMDRP